MGESRNNWNKKSSMSKAIVNVALFFFLMISIVEVACIRPASKAFNYEYGVQDDYSKTAFAKTEFQDDVGKVSGSYKLNLPDGRVQIVDYVADENGYRAKVSFIGEPQHPPLERTSIHPIYLGNVRNPSPIFEYYR